MATIDMNFSFLWQIFNSLILLVIVLAVFIGICFLQAHLSKKENKWLGLIIPIVKLSLSFLLIGLTYIEMLTYLDDPSSITLPFRNIIFIGGICNITTVIYFIIYLICRKKLKNKSAVDKMKIKDL